MISLLTSFTDLFKNSMKEANNNLERWEALMTELHYSCINNYSKQKENNLDEKVMMYEKEVFTPKLSI